MSKFVVNMDIEVEATSWFEAESIARAALERFEPSTIREIWGGEQQIINWETLSVNEKTK